jgi:glycosyltransferase involved in cell wall biosynthesis
VITIHDLAFLLYANIQTADSLRYYAGQIQRAVRQADHIIAVSYTTRDDLIRLLHVPAEKITVIWEGIHPSFRVQEHPVVELPDDYLLFVGTIEPRKNIPHLLQGYAILKSRQKTVPKLVLVGQKGWLSEESFAAIEGLGLQQDVIWLGGVPFNELPALYNRAKILVYPSLYEGFGFPPLEAMACGTPTITSDRGALKEIAGEAALYVNPDEPESIADALQKLLSDESLYQTLREKGLAHIRQFSWEQTARQTLAVYEKVLA